MNKLFGSVYASWNRTPRWFKRILNWFELGSFLNQSFNERVSPSPFRFMQAYLQSASLFRWFIKAFYVGGDVTTKPQQLAALDEARQLFKFFQDNNCLDEGIFNSAIANRYNSVCLNNAFLELSNCQVNDPNLKSVMIRCIASSQLQNFLPLLVGFYKNQIPITQDLITSININPNRGYLLFILKDLLSANILNQANLTAVLQHSKPRELYHLVYSLLRGNKLERLLTQENFNHVIEKAAQDHFVSVIEKMGLSNCLTQENFDVVVGIPDLKSLERLLHNTSSSSFYPCVQEAFQPENRALLTLNPEKAGLLWCLGPKFLTDPFWKHVVFFARQKDPELALERLSRLTDYLGTDRQGRSLETRIWALRDSYSSSSEATTLTRPRGHGLFGSSSQQQTARAGAASAPAGYSDDPSAPEEEETTTRLFH